MPDPCFISPAACAVAKVFNPFDWLADALKPTLLRFFNENQAQLFQPKLPTSGGILDKLFGNSIGFTSMSIYLVVITLTIAVFVRRVIPTAVEAVVITILLSTLVELSFIVYAWLLRERGTLVYDIASAKIFLGGTSNGMFGIPDLSGLGSLIIIICLGVMLYYAVYLLVMLFVEVLGIIVAKAGTPLGIMLLPYGDRGKQLLSTCWAAGFVSTFAGPVMASLVLEFGKVLIIAFNSSAIAQSLFAAMTFRSAAQLQRTLYERMKAKTLNKIRGITFGKSLVSGDVSASFKERVSLNVRRQASQAHAASMQPVPVKMVNNADKPGKFKHYGGALAREAAIFATGIGAAKLATTAGTSLTNRALHQALDATHTSLKKRRGRDRRR